MKILLVGGGTAGSVTPLLAVAARIKQTHPKAEFLFVGTKHGPERHMAEAAKIEFIDIAAGKLRRYFSLKNLSAPVLMLVGFFQALTLLREHQPDCVVATGSFVQVPLVWAAKILKIPIVVHQQDLLPGLANKLSQWAANKITVSFEESLKSFSSGLGLFYKKAKAERIVLTGNPFREELAGVSKQKALEAFSLKSDWPTLLVLGGGTGAQALNELVWGSLPELTKTVQIIHSTGEDKIKVKSYDNYQAFEFIQDMASAYAAADMVLSRAGLSTITELSNLKKVAIIVPMPNSHQEINAWFLLKKGAAIVYQQNKFTPQNLINLMRKLLFEQELLNNLKHNMGNLMPHNATEKVSDVVIRAAEGVA